MNPSKHHSPKLTLQSIIALLIVMTMIVPAAGLISSQAAPARPSAQPRVGLVALPLPEGPPQPPEYDLTIMRIYYNDQAHLNAIAGELDIWEVNKKEMYAVAMVQPGRYTRLESLGYRLEIDAELTAQASRPLQALPGQINGIPGFPCYRTVEETFQTAADIASNYPQLAEWIDAGDSWEKVTPGGNPGYDMMVLKLTNSSIPGPKPKLFIMTAVHAREYTTAELGTRFAEYLVENYAIDPDVTWLLDYTEIHLMLQANPDGRKHAEGGVSWRKNTNENYCSPTSNYRGADLNRNFEFQWGCCGGSSGSECDITYRGPSAASEPETQAIQNYVRSILPDQRTDDLNAPAPDDATGIFIDIHSYSELVLWPWGFTATNAPNRNALQTLGRKFAYFNNYRPEQAMSLYVTDGTTDDFAYGELGLAAYTFELGTSFFQSCSVFENTILPDNLPALIYAAKTSRTPYMTPAGPDALSLTVVPGGVAPGDSAQLIATINDTRFNNSNGTEPTQNIAAAEYYIDIPAWITTTTPISYPMTAADGNFNSTVEAVEAAVDTIGLSAGRHTVFVRGQDAAGNWGPFSAAFIYIIEPGVSPLIEGYVRDASNNAPIDATITASTFQAVSDPATGYYSMTVISGTYTMNATAAGYAAASVTGVAVHDYQTVQQDFTLYPVCDIFTDTVESGNPGWAAQGNWAITAEASHSPAHSWTDSPGGSYGNYWNYSLTSPVWDFSNYDGVTLDFWHIYDLEDDFDYGYLEYSTNGSTWVTLATYNGENQTTWMQETMDISALDGEAAAQIRFRLDTDQSITEDGWHIDDIFISGGGPVCGGTDTPPTAAFTSDSSVTSGMPIHFTNTTTGTLPIDYAWDFGDGIGTSTESDPAYTYTIANVYTVTLVATNTLGSDSVSQQVIVDPNLTVDIDQVDLTLVTPGTIITNTLVEFAADIIPNGATEPYTYTLDFGDTTALVTATSSIDPLPITHTFTATGTYTVTIDVWNLGMITPVTDAVSVSVDKPSECVDLTSITIAGAAGGEPGVYIFTTSYTPAGASPPVTYLWDNGDTTAASTRTLVDGTQNLAVTATNCTGASAVDDHTIVINTPNVFKIFIPFLTR